MNPLLSHLQPYPFERLRQLFAGVTPPAAYSPISLGMGEPRHPHRSSSKMHSVTTWADWPVTQPPQANPSCAKPSPNGYNSAMR